MREDDPADFLLEACRASAAGQHSTRKRAGAGSQCAALQRTLSNTLAAIETRIVRGRHAATARAEVPAPLKAGGSPTRAAAVAPTPPVTDGPLAALMAMSEEERIALFS